MSAPSGSKSEQRASPGGDSMVETEQPTTPAPETMQTPPCGRRPMQQTSVTTPDTSAGTSGLLKRPRSSPRVSHSVSQITPPLSPPRSRQRLTSSSLSLAEEQDNIAMDGK